MTLPVLVKWLRELASNSTSTANFIINTAKPSVVSGVSFINKQQLRVYPNCQRQEGQISNYQKMLAKHWQGLRALLPLLNNMPLQSSTNTKQY